MMLEVDISKFRQQMQKLQDGLQQVVSQGLQEIAEQGAKTAREQKEFKSHGTGGLEDAIQAYRNSALQQGILANKPYASWVEYGNGPAGSKIYPTSAKALHFYIDGKEVFAKYVTASAPKPFMSKAVSFVNQSGEQIMARHLNNFIRGL